MSSFAKWADDDFQLEYLYTLQQCILVRAVKEDLITVTSKHSGGQVVRGHYIFKIPDTEVTMVAAGFADGTHFSNFHWQHHYTQGRQLLTTDQIKELCPPDIWQAISTGIFPGLDRLKEQLDNSMQHRHLTQAELELMAQVNMHWFLREVILQDSCFLLPANPNSRLWRDTELFDDPTSPFMAGLAETLTPAVQQLQSKADRVHESIITAPAGQSVLDEARSVLGIKQATTVAHSRQLLEEMIRILDRRVQDQQQPQPQQPQQQPQQVLPQVKPMKLFVTPHRV